MNKQLNKRGFIRLWLVQLGLTLAIAGVCMGVYGINAAVSAVLGGLVCILPNVLFAFKLFKYQGARAARQIVNNFYKGEALKIFSSIFLFTAVFVFYRVNPLAFFGTYIVIQITHWFAPWIINKQNRLVK